MKKQISIITLLLSIIGSVLAGMIIAITGVILYAQHTNNNVSGSQKNLQRFETVYNDLNTGYYKKTNSNQLIDNAINGMVASLDDPYTEYISAKDMEAFDDNISGDVSGIGVMVSVKNKEITIASVIKNSPAKKAGLQANDIITKIDGKDASNLTLDETSSKIKGKIGTSVKLTIRRGNKTFTKKVTRQKLTVSSIDWNIDAKDKKVGYIQIKEFTDNTAKDLKKALQKLNDKNVDRVILDLRGNPGGQLDQAVDAAGIFLKNGQTVVSTTDRSKKKITYKVQADDNDGYKFKKPVSILVDKNSASAAEVFTAALNENIETPIIGETTFGKGIVQTVVPVDNSSEFKLTTAKWLTPKNHWIHHKGIKPTIAVKADSIMDADGFKDYKEYQVGAKNADIKFSQQVLNKLGYKVKVTSELDKETVKVVKQYQKDKKLAQTGKLDKLTKESLLVSLSNYLQKNDAVYQKAITIK